MFRSGFSVLLMVVCVRCCGFCAEDLFIFVFVETFLRLGFRYGYSARKVVQFDEDIKYFGRLVLSC